MGSAKKADVSKLDNQAWPKAIPHEGVKSMIVNAVNKKQWRKSYDLASVS